MKLPVYRFLKEPLIRKYGDDWYELKGAAYDDSFHNYQLTYTYHIDGDNVESYTWQSNDAAAATGTVAET